MRRTYADNGDHSLLATTENANPAWEGNEAGRILPTQTVDGWRQGWTGVRGDEQVTSVFAPDSVYRGGLLGGLLLALGMVVIVLWRGRRWPSAAPPVGSATAPAFLLLVLAVGGGGLLAGTTGALIGARRLVRGDRDAAARGRRCAASPGGGGAAGRGCLRAATLGDISGWAGSLAWPQLLVVSAWALALGWLPLKGNRRGTPRSRWLGRSIRR